MRAASRTLRQNLVRNVGDDPLSALLTLGAIAYVAAVVAGLI